MSPAVVLVCLNVIGLVPDRPSLSFLCDPLRGSAVRVELGSAQSSHALRSRMAWAEPWRHTPIYCEGRMQRERDAGYVRFYAHRCETHGGEALP